MSHKVNSQEFKKQYFECDSVRVSELLKLIIYFNNHRCSIQLWINVAIQVVVDIIFQTLIELKLFLYRHIDYFVFLLKKQYLQIN